MPALLKMFILNANHSILICPFHLKVVLPRSVKAHLDKHHSHDVKPKQRASMQAEALALKASHPLKADYDEFPFVQPDRQPLLQIEHLPVYKGRICSICEHITTQKSADKNIKKHLRKAHSVHAASETRGTSPLQEYTRTVSAQRYFRGVSADTNAAIQRFFKVTRSTHTRDEPLLIQARSPTPNANKRNDEHTPPGVQPQYIEPLLIAPPSHNDSALRNVEEQLQKAEA